jgi:hypothetical protein
MLDDHGWITSTAIRDLELDLWNAPTDTVATVDFGPLRVADELLLRMLARMPCADHVVIEAAHWHVSLEANARLSDLRAPEAAA